MALQSPLSWLREHVVDVDTRRMPMWRRGSVRVARLVVAVGRDVASGQLTLQATSLVYTTLLSLVPLLAVSFSVLKAFGVHNQLEPFLGSFLQPLGDGSGEVTTRIVGFVENMRVGVLGAVSMAVLFYTVVSLVQKVEQAFNATWRVSNQRPLLRRFSDYLSVLLVGPVLVFAALAITAAALGSETVRSLAQLPVLGLIVDLAAALAPYLFSVAAFTFVYLFVPNTKVFALSALVGATVAGLLWQTTGWFFGLFVAGSAQYQAVYSAFATLVVFMLWLYLSWLILLIGATVAYYFQHPQRLLVADDALHTSPRVRERLALAVVTLIAAAYYGRGDAYTAVRLAERLEIPDEAVSEVLKELEAGGLLRRAEGHGAPGYVPATPPEQTRAAEVIEVIRRAGETDGLRLAPHTTPAAVSELAGVLDRGAAELLGPLTVRDLVERAQG